MVAIKQLMSTRIGDKVNISLLTDQEGLFREFKVIADKQVAEDPMTDSTKYIVENEQAVMDILKVFNVTRYTRYIIISGNLGSGKSRIVSVLSELFKYSANYFRVITENELYDGVATYGYPFMAQQRVSNLCIDDLGMRTDRVNFFGDKIDVINHLLYARHERGMVTFCTTNLTRIQFLERLDQRTRDRVESCMSWNVLAGTNYRQHES